MWTDDLAAAAERARDWLFDAALPLWATAGFNARTGFFVESLDGEGRASTETHRVRVQARQTYVFMEAGRLGWAGPWRDRALAGLGALLGPARAEGGASGHRFDAGGVLVDARRDLYDQAFTLFALAHARPLDPGAVDARIGEILDYLETQRASAGGFLEGEIAPVPRRQNPHMHLLEAGLALTGAGVSRGQALVDESARLLRSSTIRRPARLANTTAMTSHPWRGTRARSPSRGTTANGRGSWISCAGGAVRTSAFRPTASGPTPSDMACTVASSSTRCCGAAAPGRRRPVCGPRRNG